MSEKVAARTHFAVRIYAALMAAIAALLLFGGAALLIKGGSAYYLLAGAALAVSAALLWLGRPQGARIYGAFVLATVVWALWEVGLDGWSLAPRLIAPAVFGAVLLIPGMPGAPGFRGLSKGLAALAIAAGAGLALHTLTGDKPTDPAERTGRGPLPAATRQASVGSGADWLHYGGDLTGSRFSQLTQITPANAGKLTVAWTFVPGDPVNEVTPIKVGERLYLCTGGREVIALDAETGKQLWRFKGPTPKQFTRTCRGVAYYRVPEAGGLCAERIIATTATAQLVALDAATGRLCPGFGDNGKVSLLRGLTEAPAGYYNVHAQPTITRGKIILGSRVIDGQFWGEPSGVIRAYDAVSGRFLWAFDMGRLDRQSEPPPGETFTVATPNAWAQMAVDEELGLVYAPTGNATPDYYGAQRRPFDDQFSSSVLAIEVETGKLRWSFQTVRHDLWDYDIGSQPTLVDLGPDGAVKALVQPTKMGEIFVLDRVTGRPLAPVTEHPVPQKGGPPEDRLSPTQPFSDAMPSFRGPKLTEKMMWGLTPIDQLWCRLKFRQARYEGAFTPMGLTPAIIHPGYLGGMNWGGATLDPHRGLLVVNTTRLVNYNRLMPRAEADAAGVLPMGHPGSKMKTSAGAQAQYGTPYGADITPFLSPLGVPCQAPPYGKLSAIDLATRKLVWHGDLGTAEGSGPFGVASRLPIPMGTPNIGGSIATRSGLLFIGAAQDPYLRAISLADGSELWKSKLPAGPQSTPMTYISPKSGRQFVVISANGSRALRTKQGNAIVAYALPKDLVAQSQPGR